MQIKSEHCIDASDPDADGMYDWYYDYDSYRFFDTGPFAILVYADRDALGEASFTAVEDDGKGRGIRAEDFKHPLFVEAATYLRRIGRVKLKWLNPHGAGKGYEPIPLMLIVSH
jgi:hypothetical protein